MYTNVHCSTIYKIQGIGTKLNVHQQRMDKEDVVYYTMEYYSAVKKNEIMSSASTWLDLE